MKLHFFSNFRALCSYLFTFTEFGYIYSAVYLLLFNFYWVCLPIDFYSAAVCLLLFQGEAASTNSGPKFEEVALNFSRQSSLLFKLLSSIKNRQIGSQLSQLLLRIDYNRYFSTYGHDICKVTDTI